MLLNLQSCSKYQEIHSPARSLHKNHMQKKKKAQQIRIRFLPLPEKGAQMLFFCNVLPKRKQIQMNSAIPRCRNHLPEKQQNCAQVHWHIMGYWDPLHASHLAPKFSNSQQNQKKKFKKSTCAAPHARPREPAEPREAHWATGEENRPKKRGKSAGKSLHDLSRANPPQHPWLSRSDCPGAAPSTRSTAPSALKDSARARAQGCPAATVFQTHQGKTDLKARMKAVITHVAENVRYNNIPGTYSNLLQIHGVALWKDNWR